jgi:ATP-dependent Clp endopeptidase proteolytic subunit ClpP
MTKVTNWLSYQPRAAATEPAMIQIFDQIGEDWFGGSGVSAKAFSDALQSVGPGPLVVEINSPGGNVWDGLAIYNMLRGRNAQVTTRVVGIAASIASIIALAGDTVEIADAALFMIHDPSGMVAGTADDMRKMAAALDQHAEVLSGIYSKRTGKPVAQIRAAMTAETWFTAQEAVAFGLADSMTEMLAMAACWHPRAVTKTAPPAVRSALDKGIKQVEQGLGGEGLEDVTIREAYALKAGEAPSEAKIRKANAWWARNERFLEAEADSPADVAANLWGGAAGRDWFRALYAQLEEEEEQEEESIDDKISTASTSAAADGATTAPTSQQTPHKMTDSNTVVAAAPTAPTATLDASSIESIVAKAVAAAISAKAPTAAPAPEPIAPARIENLGNPLLEAHKKMQAGADRRSWLIQNHSELLRQSAIHAPQNANTFASGLVVDYLADAVITVAANRLALVSAFSRNVGLDNLRPRATVQVKKYTTGTAAQTNPTSWETNNDSTLAATSVTVNQISKNFTVTQQELNQGFSLADLAAGSADLFAYGISDVLTALMVSGNYGTAVTIGTAANFDTSDLPAILALAKNYRSKNLILDGGHLARLQFSGAANYFPDGRFDQLANGRFGFDVIAENNRWTSAETNTAGFVCGPDAIAIAAGLPVGMIAGEFIEQRTVTTNNGLSCLLSVWYSRASRSHMASYDIMFGAAAADTTQAEVLITA